MSYAAEKKLSKHKDEFGHGAIEGVAGPEAANNANAAGALVPLLALGLPTSATAAVVLVAFQMYNIQPGPMLFATEPVIVWGLIASLFIGNTLLLLLNLPLIKFWVKLLKIPRPYLYGGITTFATGKESVRFNFDFASAIPPTIAIPVMSAASGFPLISWKAANPTVPPAPDL